MVVGSIVAFKPAFVDVQKWVSTNWKGMNPSIVHIKPGVYLFEFQSEADKIAVLSRQWSFCHKSPVVLRTWDPDMDVDEVKPQTRNEWIQLHKIPFRFWTSEGLSKLASFVGKPVAIDSPTACRSRFGFARILVEVHVDETLPTEIPIIGPVFSIAGHV